jgi:hypothetical protein
MLFSQLKLNSVLPMQKSFNGDFKMFVQVELYEFFAEFVIHPKHFLVVFKREPAVERVVDFIAKFSTSLQTAAAIPETENGDGDPDKTEPLADTLCQEDMHPFLLKIFKFLLQVIFNTTCCSFSCFMFLSC